MFTIKEIADKIQARMPEGDPQTKITGINTLQDAIKGELSFLANDKYFHHCEETQATGVILNEKSYQAIKGKRDDLIFLVSDNPYLKFASLLNFFDNRPVPVKGISNQAYVDKSAQLAEGISVFPGVYIGRNVSIGKNSVIYPNTTIEDNAEIGGNCVIYSNVVVRYDCRIGNNVVIHSGTVIGSDGFGFAPDTEQTYHKILQIGKVVVEDDVEIGANVAIDRAVLGETRICKGVKLDNLIQVAHNVKIGEHTVIAALTGISGSTEIGRYNMIGGNAGFAGHIRTGDYAKVAAKSGVHKDVPENETVFGYPARPAYHTKKIEAILNRLPNYIKILKKIAKSLNISLKD